MSLWLIHVLKLNSNWSPSSCLLFKQTQRASGTTVRAFPGLKNHVPVVDRTAPSQKQSPGCPWLDDARVIPNPHSQTMPLPFKGRLVMPGRNTSSLNYRMAFVVLTSVLLLTANVEVAGGGTKRKRGRNADSGHPILVLCAAPLPHSGWPVTEEAPLVSHNPVSCSSLSPSHGTACGRIATSQHPLN